MTGVAFKALKKEKIETLGTKQRGPRIAFNRRGTYKQKKRAVLSARRT